MQVLEHMDIHEKNVLKAFANSAKAMLEKTKFTDAKKLEKLLDAKPKKLAKSKDPVAKFASLAEGARIASKELW